jgi:membrane AbrB-like protein
VNEIICFVLTLVIAVSGSIIAKKAKFPSGAMTGSILAVVIFNCLTGAAFLPKMTKPVMQIMGGALLGHAIGRGDLVKMKRITHAVFILIIALIMLNCTTAAGAYRFSGINLATALLATAPGGVSDMALIAEDLGADMQIVTILQLFRMLSIYFIFPPVLKFMDHIIDDNDHSEYLAGNYERQIKGKGKVNCVLTILISFAGGFIFYKAGIPAGFLIGAVAGSAAFNIFSEKGYIPNNWRFYIQSITGALIGSRMDMQSLIILKSLVKPALCMVTGMLIFTFLFGIIMAKRSEIDLKTSLLCLTPGGIQETSLMAADMGCDVSTVIVMHTIRLVSVICFFPIIMSLFFGG